MSSLARKTIYWIPRVLALLFTVPVLIFALLSGAAEYGGGLKGIALNSPNAIPWIILLGVVFVAWKWEKIGGYALIAMSIMFAFMFNAIDNPIVALVLLAPILISGAMFLVSAKVRGAVKSE